MPLGACSLGDAASSVAGPDGGGDGQAERATDSAPAPAASDDGATGGDATQETTASAPAQPVLGDPVASAEFTSEGGVPFRVDVLRLGPSGGDTTRLDFTITNLSDEMVWEPRNTVFGLSNFSGLELIDLTNNLQYGVIAANSGFDCVCSPFEDRVFDPGETRSFEARFDTIGSNVGTVDLRLKDVGLVYDVPVSR